MNKKDVQSNCVHITEFQSNYRAGCVHSIEHSVFELKNSLKFSIANR